LTQTIETVATVLETELKPTIERWMKRVGTISELTKIPLSDEERTGHLPQLLRDLIARLRGGEEFAERSETSQPTITVGFGSIRATPLRCW
jgi:hypothetical protein